MIKQLNRYEWVNMFDFIVYDKLTNKEIQCFEKRRIVDSNNREFYPMFLKDELCNKEFFMWAIDLLFFSKKINLKNDYSATKFSKNIYVPTYFIDNDIIYKLINKNYTFIRKIPDGLLTDDMIDCALSKVPSILAKISKERRTRERCIRAVKRCGTLLTFVPDNIKTVDICMEAVLNNSSAIQYVPSRIINEDFIKRLISSGIEIEESYNNYINKCLNLHKSVSNEISKDNVIVDDNLLNTSLEQVSDYFSVKSLKTLKSLEIYTLGQFFERVVSKDFILSLGNNKGVISEIYAAHRLLKCKYFDCNPDIDINDDSISFEEICNLMGFNTSIYNHLMSKYNITSSKMFFDLIQSNDVYVKLTRVHNLGNISIKRVLTRSAIVIKYYKNHNDNKKKILK